MIACAELPSPLILFLSGPIQSSRAAPYPVWDEAAQQLREAGYRVVSAREFGVREGWRWADYMRRDLRILMDCTALVSLGGWGASVGSTIEHNLAFDLKMPIACIEDWIKLIQQPCPLVISCVLHRSLSKKGS
jgi:Domain of unknown function (DUF4406)